MKDLTKECEKVWSAVSLEAKRNAMTNLIEASHAKKETKLKALRMLPKMKAHQVDKFAANYMMSGEGLGV